MSSVFGLRAVINGQVQGLGFRPHVYRLAKTFSVRGFVHNSNRGVTVVVQGRHARRFLDHLRRNLPPLAVVASFNVTRVRTRPYKTFTIKPSRIETGAGVDVLPDLATCPDCRHEIASPRDRRYEYAFTNCTQCGPRYSIIETLPYDRPRTTMAGFMMCAQCRREYENPADRRHHAQPIACPDCGPQLSVVGGTTGSDPIAVAAQALLDGRIVAIKSLGGFQLACDATSDEAVRRLRRRKDRPAKPLALMCESAAVARRFAVVGAVARAVMLSSAAPIVLLPKRPVPLLRIADAIAPGNSRVGVMICYTPLHVLLFDRLRRLSGKPAVLVMTSANRKDDPIVVDDKELAEELPGVPDLVLTHNRPIANRCDDSVVMTDTARQSPLVVVRRARGYAPKPIELAPMFHVKHPVLAMGAEFKNAFALAEGNRAFLSPHIGTVATAAGEEFWLSTFRRHVEWTGIQPEVVAADLHPDYSSTRLAERLSSSLGLPLVRVQHHYAHTLSVMAEHGLPGPALGLAFDGTGYGADDAVWGGEFLLVQDNFKWQRVGHLGCLSLIGAGNEVADPARVAREYLRQAERYRWVQGSGGSRVQVGNPPSLRTSSIGRLFDAVAAIAGVCRHASFDGQAPAALEAAADPKEDGHWFSPALLDLSVSPALLRPGPILLDVARETSAGVSPAVVSARFHNTLAIAAVRLAETLCRQHGVTTVCLSGGSFQNSRLRRRVVAGLRSHGRRVYWNQAVPINDGGIALGQVAATNDHSPLPPRP